MASASSTSGSMDVSVTIPKEPRSRYEQKIQYCSPIAKPMASKKLAKRCYKLIKKAMEHPDCLRSGLKEVQKRIRKGERGIVIFAGDVFPIEIMCHLPAVCEDKDIPYVYTPSRRDLGEVLGVRRGCIMVLIKEHAEYKEAFDEVMNEVKFLPIVL